MKRILLGIVGLVAVSSIALAAGQFAGLPIIGKAGYCQGTSTGANGNPACTTNVPAGPQSLTSTMLFPADTNFANGAQPQTVYVPAALLGSLPPAFITPLTGNTVTVPATTNTLVITPAGTLAALTVNMPAASLMVEGEQVGYLSTQAVTTLTTGAGTGNTFANTAPAALTAGQTVRYIFHALTYANGVPATGIWYRVV